MVEGLGRAWRVPVPSGLSEFACPLLNPPLGFWLEERRLGFRNWGNRGEQRLPENFLAHCFAVSLFRRDCKPDDSAVSDHSTVLAVHRLIGQVYSDSREVVVPSVPLSLPLPSVVCRLFCT